MNYALPAATPVKGLPEEKEVGESADGTSAELVWWTVGSRCGFGGRILGVLHASSLEGWGDDIQSSLDGAERLA